MGSCDGDSATRTKSSGVSPGGTQARLMVATPDLYPAIPTSIAPSKQQSEYVVPYLYI